MGLASEFRIVWWHRVQFTLSRKTSCDVKQNEDAFYCSDRTARHQLLVGSTEFPAGTDWQTGRQYYVSECRTSLKSRLQLRFHFDLSSTRLLGRAEAWLWLMASQWRRCIFEWCNNCFNNDKQTNSFPRFLCGWI